MPREFSSSQGMGVGVRVWLLAIGLGLSWTAAGARGPDGEESTTARLCFSTFEPRTQVEKPFGPESRPGPALRIRLHLSVTADSVVLVAPFHRRKRTLADGWLPECVEVRGQQQTTLPVKPDSWSWEKESGSFEFQVYLLNRRHPAAEELERLVASIKRPGAPPQEVNRLVEEMSARLLGLRRQLPGPSTISRPDNVAGVTRSLFDWARHAVQVEFSADRPGYYVVKSN